MPANLVSDEDCKQLAAKLAALEPKLHILFNNAGATWGSNSYEEHPESAWNKIFSLNVFSPFHLTRALLPQLEAAATDDDWARVINIGSVAGLTTSRFDNAPAYAASKSSVIHLSRHQAIQLAERSTHSALFFIHTFLCNFLIRAVFAIEISVNCIAPGVFPSRMATFLTDEVRSEATLSTIPMGTSRLFS